MTRAIVLRGVDMNSPVALDSLAALYADQPVLHAGRRATFLHMSGGVAIITYWGGSHAVAVPPESLSLRPTRRTLGPMPRAARDEPMTRESAEPW
jgi:hypothetical protein